VLAEDGSELEVITEDGEVAAFDLSEVDLRDPQAITVAPSSDSTDPESELNVFIADAGEADGTFSGITEVELGEAFSVAAVGAPYVTGTLVNVIETSQFNPGSPDPSGITYFPDRNSLLHVDSEVNEQTGAGFNGVNLWESTLTGTVINTGNLVVEDPTDADEVISDEPTGADYSPATGQLFISDDSGGRIIILTRGPDGLWATADDGVSFINSENDFGSTDVEDPGYHEKTGDLFQLDGGQQEVYRIDPVDGVFGNGNDTATSFDISALGNDFEGLAINQATGTLFVANRADGQIFEMTTSGTVLRTIDVDGTPGLQFISGLAYAPASDGSNYMNFYVVDRGVDNGANPNENDGQIFEFRGDPIDTTPPTVTFDSPTNLTLGVADLQGTVTDDDSGVDRMRVRIRHQQSGDYWNATTNSWQSGWAWNTSTITGNDWTLNNVDFDRTGNYNIRLFAWDNENNRANWPDNPNPTLTVN